MIFFCSVQVSFHGAIDISNDGLAKSADIHENDPDEEGLVHGELLITMSILHCIVYDRDQGDYNESQAASYEQNVLVALLVGVCLQLTDAVNSD